MSRVSRVWQAVAAALLLAAPEAVSAQSSYTIERIAGRGDPAPGGGWLDSFRDVDLDDLQGLAGGKGDGGA